MKTLLILYLCLIQPSGEGVALCTLSIVEWPHKGNRFFETCQDEADHINENSHAVETEDGYLIQYAECKRDT